MEENKIEKLAEEFADAHERRGCAYWNGLYRGYIAGIAHFISSKQDVIKSVCVHKDRWVGKAVIEYCKDCETALQIDKQTVL